MDIKGFINSVDDKILSRFLTGDDYAAEHLRGLYAEQSKRGHGSVVADSGSRVHHLAVPAPSPETLEHVIFEGKVYEVEFDHDWDGSIILSVNGVDRDNVCEDFIADLYHEYVDSHNPYSRKRA
jgi:hypothetical protein